MRRWACRRSPPMPACPANVLDEVARPDKAGLALLRDAADAMRLTARAYHRVLKVARTLADLDGEDKVGRIHLAEALSYRSRIDQPARRRPDGASWIDAAWLPKPAV